MLGLGMLSLAWAVSGSMAAVDAASDDVTAPTTLVHRDFRVARRAFFEAADPEERKTAFEDMSGELANVLRGQLYSHSSERVRRAVRDHAYGLLRNLGSFQQHVRNLVSAPSIFQASECRTAAELLADTADTADFAALLSGFRSEESQYALLPPIGRALGRAIGTLRADGGRDAEVGAGIDALRSRLLHPSACVQVASVAGMIAAGLGVEADADLHRLIGEKAGLTERLRALEALQRSFIDPGVPEPVQQAAEDLARGVIVRFLETGPPAQRTGLHGLSGPIQQFKNSVAVLRTLAPQENCELLLSCMKVTDATTLLGIDGLQRLRLAYQFDRDALTAAQRRFCDEHFRDLLLVDAERLFSVFEEPMDQAEHYAYVARRDIRYNAASYFTSLWDKEETVRQMWAEAVDAPELLELIVLSTEDVSVDDGDEKWFEGVRDKTEARVQVARLLAKMATTFKGAVAPSFSLTHFFVELVAIEMGCEPAAMVAGYDEWLGTSDPNVVFRIPEIRPPADDFLKIAGLNGLGLTGVTVLLDDDGHVLVTRER